MDNERQGRHRQTADIPDQRSRSDGGGGSADFEFEVDPTAVEPHPRRITRLVVRTLTVLLLTALLVAIAGEPNLARLFQRDGDDGAVPVVVICDVPWAVIRVDGHGSATSCAQGISGALPMARLQVASGAHALVATADGFAPYPIHIVAHPYTPALYMTQFTLAPQEAAHLLSAVNTYLAHAYTQDVIFPTMFWPMLGLRNPPPGSSLVVRERFEATSLDSYKPFYTETTYQRPVVPEPEMIGVAVVVVEHVAVYSDCGTAPLLERRQPVLYTTRASVTFSAHPDHNRWSVTKPYTLNPTADIYTAPDLAATLMTPVGLLALAARTYLAQRLGKRSLLANAPAATPLISARHWAGGVVLSLANGNHQTSRVAGERSGAVWLYTAGILLALTPAAQALSPGASSIAPPVGVNNVRTSLANQPPHVCGK